VTAYSFLRLLLLAVLLSVGATTGAAAKMRIERDIAYVTDDGGRGKAQQLDLYAPKGGTAHPIVIWIHGGGWRLGDKRSGRDKAQPFVDQGYILVSINYRLEADSTFRQQAADVAAAIRWVFANALREGGDASSIFLLGHSAGAHLAALVSTDAGYLGRRRLTLPTLRGTILLDGAAYDIPQLVAQSGERLRKLYTTVFSEDEATQRAASPVTYVAPGKGIPPFLIAHVADRPASTAESSLFAAALREAGVEVTVFAAEGKTHASINRELGQPGDETTQQVFAFLDSHRADARPAAGD